MSITMMIDCCNTKKIKKQDQRTVIFPIDLGKKRHNGSVFNRLQRRVDKEVFFRAGSGNDGLSFRHSVGPTRGGLLQKKLGRVIYHNL